MNFTLKECIKWVKTTMNNVHIPPCNIKYEWNMLLSILQNLEILEELQTNLTCPLEDILQLSNHKTEKFETNEYKFILTFLKNKLYLTPAKLYIADNLLCCCKLSDGELNKATQDIFDYWTDHNVSINEALIYYYNGGFEQYEEN